MIDTGAVGFNQFLRRSIGGEIESSGLYSSSLGAGGSQGMYDMLDTLPAFNLAEINTSQLVGELNIQNLKAVNGFIGGWIITSGVLRTGNLTIDSINRRILVNDGSFNRVLIGDDGT